MAQSTYQIHKKNQDIMNHTYQLTVTTNAVHDNASVAPAVAVRVVGLALDVPKAWHLKLPVDEML
jgi:hypothetical protein